jgi:hypothetical protein
MMNNGTQLERIRYWQGQLLASGDLRSQMASVAELRRQHNRAVHGAYGIAIGLATGDIVSGALPVTCGLAYDCKGRELLAPVDHSVPLPSTPFAAPQLLLLSYDASAGESVFSWQPQGSPSLMNGVAIARLLPSGAGPMLDSAFRPTIARPMARPKIADGATVPGNTPWESWDEGGVSLGVQTVIDTSAAGFTSTPIYLAEAVTDNATADFVPAWFTSIADAAPDSFTVRLFMRRITRESFDILDPKSKAAKTPPVGGSVTIAAGNIFTIDDWVSRLLPITASVSVVKALSGNTATIDPPFDTFTGTKEAAFGNSPRIATVTKAAAAAAGFAVTVETPANFQAGSIVAKLGANYASARPTTVTSLDDSGELELANPITGLAVNDQLGVAQTPSLIVTATATTVTVQNPALFNNGDIVVCVDSPVESLTPAKITGVSGASNEILTLTPAIALSNTSHIAVVQPGGLVQTIDTETGEVKIQVDQTKIYRTGDLVAKISAGGAFSEPVRVQSVQSNTKTLTLSQAIAGLNLNDQIAAADFRVRSTVLNVSADGITVSVVNASLFPGGSFVARLDDSYTPTGNATVNTSSGTTLTLHAAIGGLKAGDILALCSFPVTVTVQSIDASGILQVTPSGLIKAGDVVASLAAHAGVAIVAASGGSSVQLATPIAGLAANDPLSVVTIGGSLNVTAGTSNAKVTLEAGNRVRMGDFIGDIAGWREPGPVRSIAEVVNTSGADLALSSQLDGLMINDTIGFSSLSDTFGLWLELRLKELPTLTPGDEALLVGLDRLRGSTVSMYATVELVIAASKIVLLHVEGSPGAFTIRPEDLSASTLFVRGSPLALVQNQNLYVSWVACQTPDPMPRPCPQQTASDCGCQPVNQ